MVTLVIFKLQPQVTLKSEKEQKIYIKTILDLVKERCHYARKKLYHKNEFGQK